MNEPHTTNRQRLEGRLRALYGSRASGLLDEIDTILSRHAVGGDPPGDLWSERDVALITYGDMIGAEGERPLATLRRFLGATLSDEISIVHVLPFFPWSSDDGFSVIDYRTVDPALGDWEDLVELGQDFRLMADLVANHCSSESRWFADLLADREPGRRFFVTAEPDADLSQVVRPRSHPLLTRYETAGGPRWVWTTFSADQVDLDYREPAVLLEMLDVLVELVARGVRVVRLDAIAYLWKRIGTSCIHLDETHQVVRVMRDVLELTGAGVVVLTETNVPHGENVAYFGDGDEAHMVYQFTLPPLVLHAIHEEDARTLGRWAAELAPPPPGCTFLNFTASHDGVGVRPLEGLVEPEALDRLVAAIRERGGKVGMRRMADGSERPYELNITYFDAFAEPGVMSTSAQVARFLCSQTIMLAFRGVPAFYFHSLVGSRNASEAVEELGYDRAINRARFDYGELMRTLACAGHEAKIFDELRRRIQIRASQPAFHPDAEQRVLELDPALLTFERIPIGGGPSVCCAHNVSGGPVVLPALVDAVDLLTDRHLSCGSVSIPPWGCVWLKGGG